MRKTDRVYGVIYGKIREIAQHKRRFTWLDLPFPREQSNNNLYSMAHCGELRVVERGKAGRFGSKPAVFELAR